MNEAVKEKLAEIAGQIGGTPIVRLENEIYGKFEAANPAGSIKDRAAFYLSLIHI